MISQNIALTLSAFLAVLVFLFAGQTQAQNLVGDASFESGDEVFCGIMGASDFGNNLNDWTSPTQGTPQLFFTNVNSDCWNAQPTSTYPGPIGIKGSQLPWDGESMAGIYAYTIPDFNQRHYIQSPLSSPLIPGQAYKIGFYASLADYMEFGSNGLGAHLSEGGMSANNDGVLTATPQVVSEEVLSDYIRWTLISDTVIADAAYDHITIGNFQTDAITVLESNPASTGAVGTYGAFYFIDGVYVEPVTLSNIDVPKAPDAWDIQTSSTGLTIIDQHPGNHFKATLFGFDGKRMFEVEGMNQIEIPWSAWNSSCALIKLNDGEKQVSQRICRPF
tara:strand:- start:88 stop:1086 length:999 start_codon:yes stop_codon:yes gene_type:complete